MAEHQDGEEPGSEAPAPETKNQLPAVDAPPLSPAEQESAPEPVTGFALVPADPILSPPFTRPAPWLKRQALLAAAMVVMAAGFGAAVGAFASSMLTPPPSHDVAGLEERKAMQQTITHLTKQVTQLKTHLAKVDKAEHTQIAKISERLDTRAAPEITGSIPQRVDAKPVPMPRPAPRVAAAPSRPPVVPDWTIRDVRDGFVYVQGHGDIYQVVPGAPLPGLGPVQAITRQGGHWLVATPRGIIVSLRDRRFFE